MPPRQVSSTTARAALFQGAARVVALAGLLCAVAFADVDPETPATPFPPEVILERGERQIRAVKYGPDDAGLVTNCAPAEDDPSRVTRVVYYDVPPYLVHVFIDKNVIRAPVVFARKKEGGDGELEAYNGTAVARDENDAECLPIIKPDLKPASVFVDQGKTKLTGSKLEYTEETGIAVIQGPIVFERPQDKGEVLRGNSEKITVDVDNEKTFLEGKVTLRSKCRTSSADRVEYDDRANRAILFGKPAVSSSLDGKDTIRGEQLEYDLDTNDVVVTASNDGITGQFEDDAAPCR
jgi:lipopolysaccharide export system protein LptA